MKRNTGLLMICMAGLCLRLYHLDRINLWMDELFTAARAGIPFIEMLRDAKGINFPPLYFIIMNLWAKLFGTSPLSLRLPSLIFSALSILLIFRLAREMYNDRVAFFSAALLAISPYSINYGQEAKMYSMLWLLSILSFFYFYKFIKSGRRGDLYAYAFFTAVSLYTMYLGFFFIAIHNLYFFFQRGKKKTVAWLIAQAAILLLYLPWLPRLLYHLSHWKDRMGWIPNEMGSYPGGAMDAFSWISGTAFGPNPRINRIDLYIYLFFAASGLIIWKNIRSGKGIFELKKEGWLLLSWLGIPLFIVRLMDVWVPHISHVNKYVGLIHIPLIILLAKGIDSYDQVLGKIKLRFIIFAALSLMIASNHLYPYYRDGLKISRDSLVECFQWLKKSAGKDSLIVNINVPSPIVEYFYPNDKIGDQEGLTAKGINGYQSVFLVFCFDAKEKKYKLVNDMAEKLQLFVFDEICRPWTIHGQEGVLWMKKTPVTGK
jgi:uncharacterized membrane protein